MGGRASAVVVSIVLLSNSSLNMKRLRLTGRDKSNSLGGGCGAGGLEFLTNDAVTSLSFLEAFGCRMLYMNTPVTIRKNATT